MGNQFPISGDGPIRIAMLGMVDGNGHPYSWSAMFNGYDAESMRECPFPVIPEYLAKEPPENFGIGNATVTHIWTDSPEDAPRVARASRIPSVAGHPEDVIGEVDAVIIATDKGDEHVERCRPFVEAGLPVFVDKPLVDNAADLDVFNQWVADGKPIMSGSSLRYTKEFEPWHGSTHDLGQLRYGSITMCKTWERYGIHALEAIYPIFGPGFLSVCNTGDEERNITHFSHACGADVNVVVSRDMAGGAGLLTLCGTAGAVQARAHDSYYSFKKLLEQFIRFLRTGTRSFPWSETDELMRMLIGGIESRRRGGAKVLLQD